MRKTVSIIVTGKVQGVYYRQSTREKARELDITGHVSNQRDASVLIVATGTHEALERLIAWCKQGPPRALVTAVEFREIELKDFDSFSILR
jgi:acylphosphatase